jgi:hypothetical protein
MIEVIEAAGIAVLTAAVYGGYAYTTGKLSTPGEGFDKAKFVGTLLVSAGVGSVFYFAELPVNEASVVGILATIGGVELGQKIVKPVYAWLKAKLGFE